MFIVYNGFLYRYTNRKKEVYRLLTCDKSKVDSSFQLNDDIYFKEIPKDGENIQDLYDLQFFFRVG